MEVLVKELKVIIIGFENNEAGWVRCCFMDRFGKIHQFNEQIPMVSNNYHPSEFPIEGYLTCNVLKIINNIATIDVLFGITQSDGSRTPFFEVYETQLREHPTIRSK